MDKNTFQQEIAEFKKRNNLSFSFGDVSLPVTYREGLNVLTVQMPASQVIMPVNYSIDLLDNLHNLMEKLLEKYPHLED